MFISVLFPEPLVPMTATYSLRSTCRSTPSSARIFSGPTTYCLVICLRSMTIGQLAPSDCMPATVARVAGCVVV